MSKSVRRAERGLVRRLELIVPGTPGTHGTHGTNAANRGGKHGGRMSEWQVGEKVGLTGFEPVTLRLSSACSNQLSYKPGQAVAPWR